MLNRHWLSKLAVAGLLGGAAVFAAQAAEVPIGEPKEVAGLEIAAVYLQPIEMEPAGMMRLAKDSDIHLEADIRALKDNLNGFGEGDWVPHLGVRYKLVKSGQSEVLEGELMPMVANDGPHYGDNVKLMGAGKYSLTITVVPPSMVSGGEHFGRHVDKETGVAPWFEPVEAQYEFTFAGTGKKGGY